MIFWNFSLGHLSLRVLVKGKRESANDVSLLLGTSYEEFVSPPVVTEALRQLGGCLSARPSAAWQDVVTAAASDVDLSLGHTSGALHCVCCCCRLSSSCAEVLHRWDNLTPESTLKTRPSGKGQSSPKLSVSGSRSCAFQHKVLLDLL